MMKRLCRIFVFAVTLAGCEDGVAPLTGPLPRPPATDPPVSPLPSPETLEAVPWNSLGLIEVVDQDCRAAEEVDPATQLFHNERTYRFLWTGECSPEELAPLTAPDGHQLTAGEWVQATGEVTITCVEEGTRYDFLFQHLVPEGVYSIWHNLGLANRGYGALASHPGDIRNIFTATESGAAAFSVTGTEGPMTGHGFVPSCTLPVPSGSWIFLLVYHKDSQAGGDQLARETAVSQLGFEGK